MDHFCPWIGGVVSETNMKFFLQMVMYGFLFSAFVFGVFVWLCIDHNRRLHALNGNFIAMAAVGGSFCIISLGMTMNCVQLALRNMTIVESLGNVYFLAIHIPNPEQHGAVANLDGTTEPRPYFHTITYPIPPRKSSASSQNTQLPGSHDPEAITSSSTLRTFAIVSTKPGDNPWNIGRLNNLKSILGKRYIDWILPIRNSPCCSHDNPESDYPLGLDVDRLKREYGLESWRPPSDDQLREKRRRRHSHRHQHHHRRTHSRKHPNASSEASDQNR
jgi:palmitoyltransferase